MIQSQARTLAYGDAIWIRVSLTGCLIPAIFDETPQKKHSHSNHPLEHWLKADIVARTMTRCYIKFRIFFIKTLYETFSVESMMFWLSRRQDVKFFRRPLLLTAQDFIWKLRIFSVVNRHFQS
jgi:hypothetical protein